MSERIHCYHCGKSVSSEVPEGTVVRAVVVCPECIGMISAFGTSEGQRKIIRVVAAAQSYCTGRLDIDYVELANAIEDLY